LINPISGFTPSLGKVFWLFFFFLDEDKIIKLYLLIKLKIT